MPKTRPPYPPEFRVEAVRLLRSGERSPKQLALELGCSEQSLRNWLRQDQADRGEREDMLSSQERAKLREFERENKVLRQEREILKRAAAFFARETDKPTCFGFVEAERAQFPVSLLCRVVGVTRQGYYAWKRRGPSDRELADIDLAVRIRRLHEQTEGIYGAPRIQAELRLAHGVRVGKKRVARLMRQLGLKGADGRGGGPRTTIREAGRSSAPDLVDRDFTRAEPNRLWVCDIKYVQTGQGFLFLACVQRRLQPKNHRLVNARRPQNRARPRRARHGSPHARDGRRHRALRSRLPIYEPGLRQPCQGVGNRSLHGQRRRPLGALAETFFASLKKELLKRERFTTREHARMRIFWYIECFYNPRRRHSSLDMLSPINYEQQHQTKAIAA